MLQAASPSASLSGNRAIVTYLPEVGGLSRSHRIMTGTLFLMVQNLRWPKTSHRPLHIRKTKILALEQQRHGFDFAGGVGDAVAEIQLGLVPAAFAIGEES
jgi:hypothetical protein